MLQRLSLFLFFMRKLFLIYLTGIFLFFIARLIFFLRVNNETVLRSLYDDLGMAFLVGAGFDSMVILYGLVIPFVLIFILILVTTRNYQAFLTRFLKYFTFIILVVFSLILIIDIFYYDFFQSHINILFFGFFEDDTNAVMKSVWTDYPLIRVLIFFILLMAFLYYIVNKIFITTATIEKLPSLKGAWLLSLIMTGLFLIGMRGSLGTFPLQVDDAIVSENDVINQLPLNGVFALKEAWLTRNRQMNIDGNIAWLKQIGYDNQAQAIKDYYGWPKDKADSLNLQDLYFVKTDTNEFLNQNPPHVIFFLMESMSNYNMGFHSSQLNLLGHLEKYWNSEIVFTKCLPYGNGTINTLEGLLVNTPVTSLAQSENRFVSYRSSIAIPFKQAGYQTSFVTGGKLGWRNINEFIAKQSFDLVEGNVNISDKVPGTQQCEWGVYDEFLFDYVFQKLQQSNGKPQMIFAMTTTNHTPFSLPSHYKPFPLKIPDPVKSKLITGEDMAMRNFTNLQYSNDCLGKFMDKLKASPFSKNTIVVATGDHNNLMLFEFDDHQILEKRGVPLFISIPPRYLSMHHVDTSLFVSHRDIFPSLFNLSLSKAGYFNGGDFLFGKSGEGKSYFAINLMSKESVNDYGAVRFLPEPDFFKWNATRSELIRLSEPTPELDELLLKSRAYFSSLSFFIKGEIESGQKKRESD